MIETSSKSLKKEKKGGGYSRKKDLKVALSVLTESMISI